MPFSDPNSPSAVAQNRLLHTCEDRRERGAIAILCGTDFVIECRERPALRSWLVLSTVCNRPAHDCTLARAFLGDMILATPIVF